MSNNLGCQMLKLEDRGIDFRAKTGQAQARIGFDPQKFRNLRIFRMVFTSCLLDGHRVSRVRQDLKTDDQGVVVVGIPDQVEYLQVTVELRFPRASQAKKRLCVDRSCLSGGAVTDGQYLVLNHTELFYVFGGLRSYDGKGNNLAHPEWGSAGSNLLRISPVGYADGLGQLMAVRGDLNPNPRLVSNLLVKEAKGKLDSRPNSYGLTDLTWVWGQFLDHELDLTPAGGVEDISIQTGDSSQKEEDFPDRTIPISRSVFSLGENGVREQPNLISSFIDATNVYGSSVARARALRRLDGSGKLKTSRASNGEELPPLGNQIQAGSAEAVANETHGGDPGEFYLAGDVRANENILLLGIHTIFVREHNRLCDQLLKENPLWAGQDELIYQKVRAIVIGLQQWITFQEFLPALLVDDTAGLERLSQVGEGGYREEVNPGVATEFSTAGYRLGHTMLTSQLKIGQRGNQTIRLRQLFFNPGYAKRNGVNQLLLGAGSKLQQEIDTLVIEDVRSFLFDPPSQSHLLDLASLNLSRGRDHGLPGYNDVREAYGLARKESFSQVTSRADLASLLEQVYGKVDAIDPWIGGLAEDHFGGSTMGELIREILLEQFSRLRQGDRFWFEQDPMLDDRWKDQIKETTFDQVLARNGVDLGRADVFHFEC